MIAKSACTSWVRVLLELNGSPKARRLAKRKRTYIHHRQKYYLDMTVFRNAAEMHRSPYKDFYKFMFVREPFERLISAYRDRMFGVAYYVPLRRRIIKKFRQHPSPRWQATDKLVTLLIHRFDVMCRVKSPPDATMQWRMHKINYIFSARHAPVRMNRRPNRTSWLLLTAMMFVRVSVCLSGTGALWSYGALYHGLKFMVG